MQDKEENQYEFWGRIEDEMTFDRAYKENHIDILGFVNSFIDNQEDAKDITADVFFKLWSNRHVLEKREHIRPFLFITARNACIDFLRANQRSKNFRMEMAGRNELRPPELDPEQGMIQAESIRIIYGEIEKLSPRQAEVILLACMEDLSSKEAGPIMNISDSSVRTFKGRALKLLRKALSKKNIPFISFLVHFFVVAC